MITETIPNFSGGLCSNPSELVDCATLTNFIINRDGTIQGRAGYSSTGTGFTGAPICLFKAVTSGGDVYVCQGTTKMWSLSGGVWTSEGTFAATSNTLGSMCQFGNYILATSPAYNIIQWDGGAGTDFATIAASPTSISLIAADQNYVYAVNTSNSLYYCDSGDVTTWPVAHVLSVGGERDTIHDMCFLFEKLYLFRESGIWVKAGADEDDFTLTKLSNDKCFSRVAPSHGGIYFMSTNGLQVFDGSTCRRISAKIDDDTFIPQTNGQFMYYHYAERKLYVPTSSQLYVYDELLDRWMVWTIAGMSCAMEAGPALGLYFGTTTAYVYAGWSGTTDAGTAITTTYTSKSNIDFGSPEMLKRPRHLFIDGTLTSCTVTLKSNYGATTENTFSSPARINYCTPNATPQRNFQISLSGVQGTVLRSLKLSAHPVSI